MKQVIVIGGGASGMLAAIASARGGAKTTLLEAGEKPGRKLLLTGNGRCNLTNLNDEILSVYDSSDRVEAKKLLESVFGRFSVRDTLDFFHGEGLLTSVEHGTCVYPVTGQSGSVVGILLGEFLEGTVGLLEVALVHDFHRSVVFLLCCCIPCGCGSCHLFCHGYDNRVALYKVGRNPRRLRRKQHRFRTASYK